MDLTTGGTMYPKLVSVLLTVTALLAIPVSAESPKVVLETSRGNIVLELNPEKSPKTVENFLAYVDSGFYDGTIFHRVIPKFMIQGGGMTADMAQKPTREAVVNESSNYLHNERGTVAMARTDDPDSATAQFFINLKMNTSLDYKYGKAGYTVFGEVVDGMYVVDDIALQPTAAVDGHQDVPVQPIVINRAYRQVSSDSTQHQSQ